MQEAATAQDQNPYDQVPYSSYPYAQSHPIFNAAIGRLFGLSPTPLNQARVLELGCASGGNLVPIASYYPGSQCLGIDFSKQIEQGKQHIAQSGLTNIELRQLNILDFSSAEGTFDYIICHGVFSWIPAEVQKKILAICAEQLTPQGIAYISYNVYPGWHLRGIIRDLMNFHTRKYTEPKDRAGHARAMLDFLAKQVPEENNPYGMLLRREAALLDGKADSYLLHEHLEVNNHPLYFHEFAQLFTTAGLKFLAETDWGSNSAKQFGDHAAKVIQQHSHSRIDFEQYCDYFRNRTFRQTLLCRADAQISDVPQVDQIMQLALAGPIKIEGELKLDPKAETTIQSPQGKLTTKAPHLKIALQEIGQCWPGAVSFEEIAATVKRRLLGSAIIDSKTAKQNDLTLARDLLDCVAKKFIMLCEPTALCPAADLDQPYASPSARLQAKQGTMITNAWHQMTRVNDLGRHVLQLCDGTRDLSQILTGLSTKIEHGEIQINTPEASSPDSNIEQVIMPAVQAVLLQLRDSLLVEQP